MSRLMLLGFLLPFVVAVACGVEDEGAEGIVAYEGGRLILGNGDLIENGVLVIEDERILSVGAAGEFDVPAGAGRIDVTGRTIIPALIDAHAHLGYENYHTWEAANYTRENLAQQLDLYAYYGYGAVLSMGTDPDELALDIQQAQSAGEFGGARFLFSVGMGPPGQGPNQLLLDESLRMGRTIVRGADSPDEGREKVREIAQIGVPFIKIWVTDRGGTQRKMEPEVYRAIIDEADQHGIGVLAHMETLEDMKDLTRAGLTGFVHGFPGILIDPDDELVDLLVRNDAWVVPTFGIVERQIEARRRLEDPFYTDILPTATTERLDAEMESLPALTAAEVQQRREAFRKLLDGGVDIIHGTDGGGLPDLFFGHMGHEELERYVRYGMTPMEALVSATSRAAHRLDLEDMGLLEAGNRADFVILENNPLDDIRNTRTITSVYLGGQEVDREGIRSRVSGRQ